MTKRPSLEPRRFHIYAKVKPAKPATMISVKQAAALLGVSDSRVRVLCRDGRIKGAALVGSTWVIPANPVVAAAERVRPGKIDLEKTPPTRKPVAK